MYGTIMQQLIELFRTHVVVEFSQSKRITHLRSNLKLKKILSVLLW